MKQMEQTKEEEKRLIWRLSERPTVENITKLVEKKIITEEQAKELLFNESTESQIKDLKDVQKELSLLRELVMKLSENGTTIYPIVIKQYEIYRKLYPSVPKWFVPYEMWCNTAVTSSGGVFEGNTGIVTWNNS